MLKQVLPTHSPLGASGASRWIPCPGSVGLSEGIVDGESDHATLGIAAHALAQVALNQNADAWTFIGTRYDDATETYFPVKHPGAKGILFDKDMADAVQVYLDAVRTAHPNRNQGNTWVERRFHCATIHELCFGTSDFTHVDDDARRLHVWDYKHGAGIVVEVENNPQLLYYAAGMLEALGLWEKVDNVTLYVAQPRGFHYDGPIRSWSISTAELLAWLEDVLIPAMNRAVLSVDLASGEHCRFCPARSRACPQLLADMTELETLMATVDTAPKGAEELTVEQIARILDLFERAKIVSKAASATAFNRLSAGHIVPGWKLASARANRVWRDKAEVALKKKFGKEAYTTPALKSPAEIDTLPEGRKMTAEYAFKPDTGLTVVKATDARAAVSKDTKSMFKDQKRKGDTK